VEYILPCLYDKVVIERHVHQAEILQKPNTPRAVKEFAIEKHAWLEVIPVKVVDTSLLEIRDVDQPGGQGRLLDIDPGELNGISLANEIDAKTFIANDNDAIKGAQAKGLEGLNCWDLVERAAEKGHISLDEFRRAIGTREEKGPLARMANPSTERWERLEQISQTLQAIKFEQNPVEQKSQQQQPSESEHSPFALTAEHLWERIESASKNEQLSSELLSGLIGASEQPSPLAEAFPLSSEQRKTLESVVAHMRDLEEWKKEAEAAIDDGRLSQRPVLQRELQGDVILTKQEAAFLPDWLIRDCLGSDNIKSVDGIEQAKLREIYERANARELDARRDTPDLQNAHAGLHAVMTHLEQHIGREKATPMVDISDIKLLALEQCAKKGCLTVVEDQAKAKASLLEAWKQDGLANPDKNLIVVPSTTDAQELNSAAQALRKENSYLKGPGMLVGDRTLFEDDRVHFREASADLKISQGESGTVKAVNPVGGTISIKFDSGRTFSISPRLYDAIDLAYALQKKDALDKSAENTFLLESEHMTASELVAASGRRNVKGVYTDEKSVEKEVADRVKQYTEQNQSKSQSMTASSQSQSGPTSTPGRSGPGQGSGPGGGGQNQSH
jgi:predicted nucleic acid-binding protein